MEKLHIAVHAKKHGQYIGETKSSVNTAAYSGTVTELHSHNMTQTLPHGSASVCIQSLICLQVTKRSHASDHKFLVILCDLVQPQPGQVNGSGQISVSHFHPHHSSQDFRRFFLVQLIGFFQTVYLYIIFYFQHGKILSFVIFRNRSLL